RFSQELRTNDNFWTFVVVSCIQSFDCAFEKSSFALLLEHLSEGSLSKATSGLIVSSSFFFPWVITLLLTKPIQRQGVYQVLKMIFIGRIVICSFGFIHSGRTQIAAPFLL